MDCLLFFDLAARMAGLFAVGFAVETVVCFLAIDLGATTGFF